MPVLDAIGIAGGTASKAVLFSGVHRDARPVRALHRAHHHLPEPGCRRGAGRLGGRGRHADPRTGPDRAAGRPHRLAPLEHPEPAVGTAQARRPPARADGAGRSRRGVRSTDGFWGRVTKVVMVRPVLSVVLTRRRARRPRRALRAAPAWLLGRREPAPRRHSHRLPAPGDPVRRRATLAAGRRRRRAADAGRARRPWGESSRRSARTRRSRPSRTVSWNEAGDLAVIATRLTVPANDPEAIAAVHRLRQDILPAALAGLQGPSRLRHRRDPRSTPTRWRSSTTTPPGSSRFVLGLELRSAAAGLSLDRGAAQGHHHEPALGRRRVRRPGGGLPEGLGHSLFGFQQTPSIEAWVPIFLFCILFGLSMDYHVFLLSRIREHYDRTGDNVESVAVGLKSTGRIITGAAAIMVVVFATFAAGQPGDDAAGRLRARRRRLPRRHPGAHGPRSRDHGAAGPGQLVPAPLAVLAARPARRGPTGSGRRSFGARGPGRPRTPRKPPRRPTGRPE